MANNIRKEQAFSNLIKTLKSDNTDSYYFSHLGKEVRDADLKSLLVQFQGVLRCLNKMDEKNPDHYKQALQELNKLHPLGLKNK